jgi:single-strand selective monofunctional uracil DNA glycosylase
MEKRLNVIIDDLINELQPLRFGPPVSHVYNPLEYARKAHDLYLKRYSPSPGKIVLLGMNPGPWGMAQTGVPFGEVSAVRDWLQIETPIDTPDNMHPKKPVLGFTCQKSEVSGRRLWGWAKNSFGSPDKFFNSFFVANYCPLLFLEPSGRNRTPNNLKAAEKKPLLTACDRALRRMIERIKPEQVIGIGTFARDRAVTALDGLNVTIGKITHPSPANPRANRGWERLIKEEMSNMGIRL